MRHNATFQPNSLIFIVFKSREDRIRTCDPLVPNQVRYRPALLPGAYILSGCKSKVFFVKK